MSVANGRLNAAQLRQALVESEATVERLTEENAKKQEQIDTACAEAEIVGYYGQQLDSAITCFRERIATLEADNAALTAKLAATELVMSTAPHALNCRSRPCGCVNGSRCTWKPGKCDCWRAKLPAPGALAEAIRGVAQQWSVLSKDQRSFVGFPLNSLLDRLAALAPASWWEVKRG